MSAGVPFYLVKIRSGMQSPLRSTKEFEFGKEMISSVLRGAQSEFWSGVRANSEKKLFTVHLSVSLRSPRATYTPSVTSAD